MAGAPRIIGKGLWDVDGNQYLVTAQIVNGINAGCCIVIEDPAPRPYGDALLSRNLAARAGA